MNPNVFISHSSLDQKVASAICNALEKRGLKCWQASRDVGPGENFQEAIVNAIRVTRVMVLVLTKHANESNEIKKELALASQRKLAVIPIRVEDVIPNDALAYELATRQWIDLFKGWDNAIDRLCSRIATIVSINNDSTAAGSLDPYGVNPTTCNSNQGSIPKINPVSALPGRTSGTQNLPQAIVELDVMLEINQSMFSASAFLVGSFLNNIAISGFVLAAFFFYNKNYMAVFPAFIAGLPLAFVGGGVVNHYEKVRVAGIIVCALMLLLIVSVLVAPTFQMLSLDLNKTSILSVALWTTISIFFFLFYGRGVGIFDFGMVNLPLKFHLPIWKLVLKLWSSKWFLFLGCIAMVLPSWMIFYQIVQNLSWLFILILSQALVTITSVYAFRGSAALNASATH